MGTSASRQREQTPHPPSRHPQQSQPQHQPQQARPNPPVYPPGQQFQYVPYTPQPLPQPNVYGQTPSYTPTNQPGGAFPSPYHLPSHVAAPPPTSTQQYQQTETIKNQVNLKRASLKLISVPDKPQHRALSFTFDATAACRVVAFFKATEDVKRNCTITARSSTAPVIAHYNSGKELKFPEAHSLTQQAINLSKVSIQELSQHTDDTYPIIIRLEALTDEGRAQRKSLDSLPVGGELPLWVQAQTTYATIHKDSPDAYSVQVVKQKIWYKGKNYELQEIYGMEHNRTIRGGDENAALDGGECVICMSADRDTTLLPCRHMCLCKECADNLRFQTNKCPICRHEIESVLHIKITKAKPAHDAA